MVFDGLPQLQGHNTGKIGCIQTDAAGSVRLAAVPARPRNWYAGKCDSLSFLRVWLSHLIQVPDGDERVCLSLRERGSRPPTGASLCTETLRHALSGSRSSLRVKPVSFEISIQLIQEQLNVNCTCKSSLYSFRVHDTLKGTAEYAIREGEGDMPSRDERRAALRKRSSIQVYVTAEDKRRIEDAALARGRRSSEFLRELALAEADRFEKQVRREGGTR